ncbi:MAG: DNA translocase FtsK 4TM domain-containing protein, partial [Acidobacteriota bacterium]
MLGSDRFSELVGFLFLILGLLILCSLISYFPQDPSLDTSGASVGVIHNWIGLVGSYGADALDQILGWMSYLIPTALFFVGIRLIRRKPLEAPRTKVFGLVLLLASLGT